MVVNESGRLAAGGVIHSGAVRGAFPPRGIFTRGPRRFLVGCKIGGQTGIHARRFLIRIEMGRFTFNKVTYQEVMKSAAQKGFYKTSKDVTYWQVITATDPYLLLTLARCFIIPNLKIRSCLVVEKL